MAKQSITVGIRDREAALELAKLVQRVTQDKGKRRAFLFERLTTERTRKTLGAEPSSAALRKALGILDGLTASERALLLELNETWPIQVDVDGPKGDPPLMAL